VFVPPVEFVPVATNVLFLPKEVGTAGPPFREMLCGYDAVKVSAKVPDGDAVAVLYGAPLSVIVMVEPLANPLVPTVVEEPT
jgi:hypothetical protein